MKVIFSREGKLSIRYRVMQAPATTFVVTGFSDRSAFEHGGDLAVDLNDDRAALRGRTDADIADEVAHTGDGVAACILAACERLVDLADLPSIDWPRGLGMREFLCDQQERAAARSAGARRTAVRCLDEAPPQARGA